MSLESTELLGIFAAALGGAAVGVERQRSGHATGPEAHFAGVRTFTLLGALGGLAGWLWQTHYEAFAAVLLASGGLLVVTGYAAASRRDVDGTTEVAALIVLAAGVVAGTMHFALASAVVAVTVLILIEKSRLHALVARLDDAGMRAAVRFAVMAVVVLPLLPEGPFGPLGGVRPRELWILVLIFSALSFAGYVARRTIGAHRGDVVAGLVGGFISSTAVTLGFAQRSRQERALAPALAAGVTAACTVMYVRVLVATAILHAPLAVAVAPYLWLPLLVGALASVAGARGAGGAGSPRALPENPLQFRAALQMALLFQVVLFAVRAVRDAWSGAGLLASAAVLGLTDVDALTIAMTRSATEGVPLAAAALALALGAVANTLLKLAVTLAVGDGRFRRRAAVSLTALAAAGAAALVLGRLA